MDVFNLEFRRPFLVNRSLMLAPIMGIQGFLIQQRLNILYVLLDTYSVPQFQPYAQGITEKIRSWGVGPEVGAEIKMVLPCQWTLFLKGACSCMSGQYAVDTFYPNSIDFTPVSSVILKESNSRLFSMGQTQRRSF